MSVGAGADTVALPRPYAGRVSAQRPAPSSAPRGWVIGKIAGAPVVLSPSFLLAAVVLTAAVFLVVIVGNGFLVGRQTSLQAGVNAWLAFVKRPDILATMILTAVVTVMFVYWQRKQERRGGGSGRAAG